MVGNVYIDKERLKAILFIFEKGNTNNLNNYRPISLLSSTYKILAGIIQRRLAHIIYDKMQKHNSGAEQRKAQHKPYTSLGGLLKLGTEGGWA